jgi:hypothetical protein
MRRRWYRVPSAEKGTIERDSEHAISNEMAALRCVIVSQYSFLPVEGTQSTVSANESPKGPKAHL